MTPGASEVAVILGLQYRRGDGEPSTSEFALWSRLVGLVDRYDDTPSPDATLGRWLEPAIGWRYAQEHAIEWGVGITAGPSLQQEPLVAEGLPFHARPDFLVPARARTLEAKAPRRLDPDRWGAPGPAGNLPPEYLVQLLVQVAVAHALWQVELGDLAAMARAPDSGAPEVWAEYTYRRDAALERSVVDAVNRWLDRHVVTGDPPPVDGSRSTARALESIWVPASDREVLAGAPEIEAWRRLLQSREALRELQRAVNRRRQQLQEALGPATVLRHPDGEVLATWREGKNGRRYWRIRRNNEEVEDVDE